MQYSLERICRLPWASRLRKGTDLDAEYLSRYLPLFVAIVAATGFVAMSLVLSLILAPKQFSRLKRVIYECGMQSQGNTWRQMHIRYYLYAILFVIFAVEIVFIFPWTVVVRDIGTFAFVEMLVFMGILFFGLVYAWKKGALDWW